MFLEGWDEIVESLEAHRKTYGGTSVGASAAMAASGSGFVFPDVETANGIIEDFRDRARSMSKRERLIEEATGHLERRFSRDSVSDGYRSKALASLNALMELNKSAYQYATNFADRIDQAKHAKMATEGGIAEGASGIAGRLV